MLQKSTRKLIQRVISCFIISEAADALIFSVNLLTERGRFSAAANNQKQIAEIYESDLVDYEKSMLAYEQAADWYSAEDSSAYVLL